MKFSWNIQTMNSNDSTMIQIFHSFAFSNIILLNFLAHNRHNRTKEEKKLKKEKIVGFFICEKYKNYLYEKIKNCIFSVIV